MLHLHTGGCTATDLQSENARLQQQVEDLQQQNASSTDSTSPAASAQGRPSEVRMFDCKDLRRTFSAILCAVLMGLQQAVTIQRHAANEKLTAVCVMGCN